MLEERTEMAQDAVPAELLEIRDQIDSIDRRIIELLARRFELTHRVGVLKASQDLQALDADREARKLEELRSLCEQHKLNPELISTLFSQVMEEVVRNHKKLRQRQE